VFDTLWQLYPMVQLTAVHLSERELSKDLLKRETADIFIAPSTILDGQHLEHSHWSGHYVLVVPQGYERQTHAQLFGSMPYLGYRHAGGERLMSQLAELPYLTQRGEISCVQTLLSLIGAGHCWSILPSAVLPPSPRKIRYMPLPMPLKRRISVIARPVSLLSAAARVVIEILKNSDRVGG
jgi:DNA-binding transcriptional LysR family regulator